jgi:hypothetical protein
MNKPIFTGVPEEHRYMTNRDKWNRNYIPFAGYLAGEYKDGFRAAWEIIMTRYVRMKGIVYPHEFKEFSELFKVKHPEFMRSKKINDDMFNYGEYGSYYDYKYKNVLGLFGGYGCLFPIEWDHKKPKPEKTNKFIIDSMFNELYKLKRGYKNAIDKRY